MKILTNKKGFTLVELLVVIAIIGILIGMLLPAVQSVREAARRIQCGNNMKQLSLSMHNFESANMRFPPGVQTNEGVFSANLNEPGLNWHVFVLPFIEQAPLADRINGLADPHSAYSNDLATAVISNLTCPSCPMDDVNTRRPDSGQDAGKTNYVGVWGIEISGFSNYEDLADDKNVWDPSIYSGILFINSQTGFGGITDGTSNTFVIAERDGAPVGDLTRAAATWCSGPEANFSNQCLAPVSRQLDYFINSVEENNPAVFTSISSEHTGGANFGRADGSVAFVAETVDPVIYEALGTKAGGETNVNL